MWGREISKSFSHFFSSSVTHSADHYLCLYSLFFYLSILSRSADIVSLRCLLLSSSLFRICFMFPLSLSPGEHLSLACKRWSVWICHRPRQHDKCVCSFSHCWLQVVSLNLVYKNWRTSTLYQFLVIQAVVLFSAFWDTTTHCKTIHVWCDKVTEVFVN